jgi:hypothetical protein
MANIKLQNTYLKKCVLLTGVRLSATALADSVTHAVTHAVLLTHFACDLNEKYQKKQRKPPMK